MKKLRLITALLLMAALLAGMAVVNAENAAMYIDGKNARKVHLRQEPSTKSKSLGLFYTGIAVIPISSPAEGWYQVQIGDETGYVMATYLNTERPDSKAPAAVMHNPNSNWAHLRQGASKQSKSIGRLYNDHIVYVLGELNSGWTYVQCEDQIGYVVSSFVETSASAPAATHTAVDTKRHMADANLHAVGTTGQGDVIFCLTAPTNQQQLYFVSQTKNPAVYWDDVNFDGRDDIVVTTATGASNQMFAFFVYNGLGYTMAQVNGLDYDLCNYQLFPKQQLVVSYANNGSAGACHEYAIFRWESGALKMVRRAVADVLVEQYEQNGLSIAATNAQKLKIVVTDYTSGFFSGSVVFQTVVPLSGTNTAFAHEQTSLWDGLK